MLPSFFTARPGDQYRAKADKARAQLKKDEAQALKAERDLKRIRPLFEQNAASPVSYTHLLCGISLLQAQPVRVSETLKELDMENISVVEKSDTITAAFETSAYRRCV